MSPSFPPFRGPPLPPLFSLPFWEKKIFLLARGFFFLPFFLPPFPPPSKDCSTCAWPHTGLDLFITKNRSPLFLPPSLGTSACFFPLGTSFQRFRGSAAGFFSFPPFFCFFWQAREAIPFWEFTALSVFLPPTQARSGPCFSRPLVPPPFEDVGLFFSFCARFRKPAPLAPP